MTGILSNPMQSAYIHPQDPGQYRQYQPAISSQISRGASPPRAPDWDPRFSQGAIPYHPQPYAGTYRDPTPVQTWSGYLNNAEGGGFEPILGYDFNYAGAESWGPSAAPSQTDVGYTMPSVQYTSHGDRRVEANYAGYYHPSTNQLPQNTMNFSTLPSGVHTTPNTQGASPIWKLRDCWVSYAEQDELHLTIALKRNPSA